MLELKLVGTPSLGSSESPLKRLCNNQDNRDMYWEELRRQSQRRLGRRYLKETALRLGVIKPLEMTLSDSEEDSDQGNTAEYQAALAELNRQRLEEAERQRKNLQPAQLFNVSIYPCIIRGEASGKNVGGTLEANLNGFHYSDSCIPDVMYSNIIYVFTQDGDENRAPLCHLILRNPIMVGTESRQNIQFRMVQTFDDSEMFDKEQYNSRDGDNKVMRQFSVKVNHIFNVVARRLRCKSVDKKWGFYGEVHPKDHPPFWATFVFSCSFLIQLEHTPFTAFTLDEIEIVNLVLVGSGMDTINMTIVFKEFKRDVLQINSIPSTELVTIKESLDYSGVKYYVNKIDHIPDWGSKLKEIRDYPKKFIEDGGWKFLDLEERANYSDSSGNEYSPHTDFSASSGFSEYDGVGLEQTFESVPEKKAKIEQCVNQTGYFSDSSVDSLSDHNSPGSERKRKQIGKKGPTQMKRKSVMSKEEQS
ncbi:hypothetical protein MKX03_005155 [Papaver bracteatum]|nr:hypothetical protein MKX03_005144 [Papaver bracteatum]KAI3881308.1 hypothetical protein MKX03_005155 [Papaver bracteatum]